MDIYNSDIGLDRPLKFHEYQVPKISRVQVWRLARLLNAIYSEQDSLNSSDYKEYLYMTIKWETWTIDDPSETLYDIVYCLASWKDIELAEALIAELLEKSWSTWTILKTSVNTFKRLHDFRQKEIQRQKEKNTKWVRPHKEPEELLTSTKSKAQNVLSLLDLAKWRWKKKKK